MEKVNLLSRNLAYLIKEKGQSQAEISRGIGFSASKLNNYLSGHSKPNLDDLFKLLEYFNVTASELLEINLAGGNLILNEPEHEYEKKGKLTGNARGNVMPAKAHHICPENDPELSEKPEVTGSKNELIINEIRQINDSLSSIMRILSK